MGRCFHKGQITCADGPFFATCQLFLGRIPILGTYANSVDPDQMPQHVASGQGLHVSMKNAVKMETFTRSP